MERTTLLSELTLQENQAIAAKHRKRYQTRLEAGQKGSRWVNISECERLLKVWKGIEEKKFNLGALTDEELIEYTDAIMDEDFGEGEDK